MGIANEYKEGLAILFSQKKYAAIFVLLLSALVPAYAMLTNILVASPLMINPEIRPLEAALVFAVAFLAALGFTLAAFQIELHLASKGRIGAGIIGAGAAGSAIAAFASACPICQPAWLFWLGLGSLTAFLADFGIYILALSLALLAYSVHSGLMAIAKGCAHSGKKIGTRYAKGRRDKAA